MIKRLISIAIVVQFATACGGASSGAASSPAPLSRPGTSDNNRAVLAWQVPTTEADGITPLSDLAGYLLYFRLDGLPYGPPTDVGIIPSYTLDMSNLPKGKYLFSVTAYDSQGNESAFSEEVSKTLL